MKKSKNRAQGREGDGHGTSGGQTKATDTGTQEAPVDHDWGQPAPEGEQQAEGERQAEGELEAEGEGQAEGERQEDGAQPVAADDDDDVTNRINVKNSPPPRGEEDPFESTTVDPVDFLAAAPSDGAPDGRGTTSGDDAGDGVAEAGGGLADEEQAAGAEAEPTGDGDGDGLGDGAAEVDGDVAEPLPEVEGSRLESIIESLLFAADRPLVINELKRLLGERDGKRITDALESLRARHADSGVQLVSVAGGWQLRTHPGNGAWVAKLVAGRPTRLSRAMMETLAIVAYRQPITRPEIDEIRGVDCGPVLRTLLDRALIRVIGKKEEVGRPILYGTTPEFLKIFSLRDLADLPTLREFHELGADDRAKVDATASVDGAFGAEGLPPGTPDLVSEVQRGALPDVDPEEEDSLMKALEQATEAAGRATLSATEPAEQADGAEAEGAGASSPAADAADSSEAGRR